jgi:hypothetical protein
MNRSLRAPAPFVFPLALQRRLNNYALAASAAGVSVLALVYPADAKVVFTHVHQVIGHNGVYNLDLNNDGTVDFLFKNGTEGSRPRMRCWRTQRSVMRFRELDSMPRPYRRAP